MEVEVPKNEKRKQFGTRFLKDAEDVFQQNAWDNVEWDDEQEEKAKSAIEKNSKEKLGQTEIRKFREEADTFWNTFYGVHSNRFFKDRHWLFTEFPELVSSDELSEANRYIFEIGCGVGNTILPILKHDLDEKLKVYGCDFSETAIELLKKNSVNDRKRCEVFVMDATNDSWSVPFEENSIDIIILVFVLSAIPPDKFKIVVQNCYKYLKPGGLVMFRDYGRYDMAQLRFKAGKCLQDNFYVRGDGTMVYFFTPDELQQLFVNAGFIVEQNITDRRLQVNRIRMLKMYRVWIQMKYKKPITTNL